MAITLPIFAAHAAGPGAKIIATAEYDVSLATGPVLGGGLQKSRHGAGLPYLVAVQHGMYRFARWENAALPNVDRSQKTLFRLYLQKVGLKGFEPSTSWSRTKRSSQAELQPEKGVRSEKTD